MTDKSSLHEILYQQLVRHIGERNIPSNLMSFLSEIDETYKAYDSIIHLYEIKAA